MGPNPGCRWSFLSFKASLSYFAADLATLAYLINKSTRLLTTLRYDGEMCLLSDEFNPDFVGKVVSATFLLCKPLFVSNKHLMRSLITRWLTVILL